MTARRVSLRRFVLPMGVFVAVAALHFVWLAIFPEEDSTQARWATVDASEGFVLGRYVEAGSYWLGLSYALAFAFAATAFLPRGAVLRRADTRHRGRDVLRLPRRRRLLPVRLLWLPDACRVRKCVWSALPAAHEAPRRRPHDRRRARGLAMDAVASDAVDVLPFLNGSCRAGLPPLHSPRLRTTRSQLAAGNQLLAFAFGVRYYSCGRSKSDMFVLRMMLDAGS